MSSCQTKIVLLVLLAAGTAGIGFGQEQGKPAGSPEIATPGLRQLESGLFWLGRIAHPAITESSGVIASRQYPGVLWTHNDGGGARKQTLYAIERGGHTVGEFRLVEVRLHDWEDIAIDEQNFLYVGDLGNNELRRHELAVYRIDEPNPTNKVGFVHIRASWRLLYPGKPFDCESLFIWKSRGYVVSKVFNDARAQIFSFPLEERKDPITLELVATTKIESPVAGADISPDGRLLGLIAKSGAFVYRIDGDPARAAKHKPYQHKIRNTRAEGCTFVTDGLLVTAEDRDIFLFTDQPFLWQPKTAAPIGKETAGARP
ncbi:MAG TPA: hypothetical protein VNU68_12610 [Verrucomicrobiae bacterium]|nr:hypothetical protein [Verrucomicrobiae bacterium]